MSGARNNYSKYFGKYGKCKFVLFEKLEMFCIRLNIEPDQAVDVIEKHLSLFSNDADICTIDVRSYIPISMSAWSFDRRRKYFIYDGKEVVAESGDEIKSIMGDITKYWLSNAMKTYQECMEDG
jgi:hypothetical protein